MARRVLCKMLTRFLRSQKAKSGCERQYDDGSVFLVDGGLSVGSCTGRRPELPALCILSSQLNQNKVSKRNTFAKARCDCVSTRERCFVEGDVG